MQEKFSFSAYYITLFSYKKFKILQNCVCEIWTLRNNRQKGMIINIYITYSGRNELSNLQCNNSQITSRIITSGNRRAQRWETITSLHEITEVLNIPQNSTKLWYGIEGIWKGIPYGLYPISKFTRTLYPTSGTSK